MDRLGHLERREPLLAVGGQLLRIGLTLECDRCADELAQGAVRVLQVDAAVATTGVGGPDSQEGEEPGTVYVGVIVPGGGGCHRLELDGSPDEVVEQATERALDLLLEALESSGDEA